MKDDDDPSKAQVKDVLCGWTLKDGRLHLLVKCKDGVIRPISLTQKNF